MTVRIRIFLMIVFVMFTGSAALACGPNTVCMVGERHYRIALPDGHDGASLVPALVFAHGYRGSDSGVMRNGSLRRLASDLGVALIAVKSVGPGWDLPNGPRNMRSDGSSEFTYFDAVMSDAAERFAIDRRRTAVSGFSAGGMMVWNLACARPDLFAAFIPIAGTYWLEPPKSCAAPVTSIIHIHGDADETVPLLGRQIGPTKQGEVPEAIANYADHGAFGPAERHQYDGLTCLERQNNGGERLDFCLFAGGHSFRTEHLRHAWEQLAKAGRL